MGAITLLTIFKSSLVPKWCRRWFNWIISIMWPALLCIVASSSIRGLLLALLRIQDDGGSRLNLDLPLIAFVVYLSSLSPCLTALSYKYAFCFFFPSIPKKKILWRGRRMWFLWSFEVHTFYVGEVSNILNVPIKLMTVNLNVCNPATKTIDIEVQNPIIPPW